MADPTEDEAMRRAREWLHAYDTRYEHDPVTQDPVGTLAALLDEAEARGAEEEQARILKRIDGEGPGDDLEIMLKAYTRGMTDGTKTGAEAERAAVVKAVDCELSRRPGDPFLAALRDAIEAGAHRKAAT